jgi:hypothetical protein
MNHTVSKRLPKKIEYSSLHRVSQENDIKGMPKEIFYPNQSNIYIFLYLHLPAIFPVAGCCTQEKSDRYRYKRKNGDER